VVDGGLLGGVAAEDGVGNLAVDASTALVTDLPR
jgi:hypothetical protein